MEKITVIKQMEQEVLLPIFYRRSSGEYHTYYGIIGPNTWMMADNFGIRFYTNCAATKTVEMLLSSPQFEKITKEEFSDFAKKQIGVIGANITNLLWGAGVVD